MFWNSVFAQALAGKLDPVSVVNEAVEDGIGECWIADHVMPAIDRHQRPRVYRGTLVRSADRLLAAKIGGVVAVFVACRDHQRSKTDDVGGLWVI